MFKTQNFCHIASNNRNTVKVGVFVYRTTDNLATVSASGYFNGRIIDINLHDLIIHEQVDSADATKVKRNLLCVTERTLENVKASVIKSDWEGDTEQALIDLRTYIDNNFVKTDGTSVMTGPLKFSAGSMRGAIAPYLNGVSFWKMDSQGNITNIANLTDSQFLPVTTNSIDLGNTTHTWKDVHVARVITSVLNNGYDIAVPVTNSADTLALKSEVDLAANSGRMITDQGVWYAKMYSATVAPSAEDDTNYADFSQTDGQGNPIIVIYTRTSGAWVQSETITPPAEYDGYVPITSKIWDIPEQAGQQGGRILWNHQSKEFTPYPQIISFEDITVTGNSTVTMPVNPGNTQIVNKQYVDNIVANTGSGRNVGDIFLTQRTDSALNGAVECNGSTYNTTDFSGAQTIGDLLEDGKIPYVSLSQYQTLLEAYGYCGVIGWNGTGTTVFRVPTLEEWMMQSNSTDVTTASTNHIGGSTAMKLGTLGTSTPVNRGSGNPLCTFGDAGIGTNNAGGSSWGSQNEMLAPINLVAEHSAVQNRVMIQLALTATDTAVETCTQVLSDVADLKDHRIIAFQAPSAQNNYTWYRKYADGWIEMGGHYTHNNVEGTVTITLPVTMADTHYTITMSKELGSDAVANMNYQFMCAYVMNSKTTTTFQIRMTSADRLNGADWEVKGMYAA